METQGDLDDYERHMRDYMQTDAQSKVTTTLEKFIVKKIQFIKERDEMAKVKNKPALTKEERASLIDKGLESRIWAPYEFKESLMLDDDLFIAALHEKNRKRLNNYPDHAIKFFSDGTQTRWNEHGDIDKTSGKQYANAESKSSNDTSA